MVFRAKCVNCGTVYDLSDAKLRQCLQCGKCHKRFFIPSADKLDSGGTYPAKPLPADAIKISCPKCKSNYELTTEFIGQEVECVTCSKQFFVRKPLILTPPKTEPQSPVVEDNFADDRTVKLKRQPDGKPQGMIPDYGQPKQKVATPPPPTAQNSSIPEHFPVFCSQCGLKYEVTKELVGEQAECECGHLFRIIAPRPRRTPKPTPVAPPKPKPPLPVAAPEKSFATEMEKLLAKRQKPPATEEKFVDDRTVKLKKQSDGKPQGMIPDYGPPKQTTAPATPQHVNVPEHFPVFCPKCNVKYEVTKELIGEQAECECGHLFKITAPAPKPKSNIAPKPLTKPQPVAPPKPETPPVSPKEPIKEEAKSPVVEENFDDDRTVKLKKQPNGKPQGLIPDYGPPKQTTAPATPQHVNVPEHFPVFCPECSVKYEVTKELIGEQAECECGHLFKIAAPAPKPKAPPKPATSSTETTSSTRTTSAARTTSSTQTRATRRRSRVKPKPEPKPDTTPPVIPWYMFWKRLFGKS